MVYAVVKETMGRFEFALGRPIHWRADRDREDAPYRGTLRIFPVLTSASSSLASRNDAGEVNWSPSALSSGSDFETRVSTPFASLRRKSWRSLVMKRSEKSSAAISTSKPAAASLTEEAIRQRAYELYEQRGRMDGHAVEDWLTAEAELQRKSKSAVA
jgi:hypothetical protein